MPMDGRFVGSALEKAWLASMTSLPLYSNGSARAKTKNGAPLPTRFATLIECTVLAAATWLTSCEKFVVRKVSVIVVLLIALTVPTSATHRRWLCGTLPGFGKPAKPDRSFVESRVRVPPDTEKT